LVRLLGEMQERRQQAEVMRDEEKVLGFTVDNLLLKEQVVEALSNNIEGVIQLIKYSIKLESEQVEEYISNVMGKLESKPANMQQMAEALRDFEQIQLSEQQIQAKIAGIEKKNANIRALTGASFNTNNMLKRW
jgi:dynein heavy chain 2, cytosolic